VVQPDTNFLFYFDAKPSFACRIGYIVLTFISLPIHSSSYTSGSKEFHLLQPLSLCGDKQDRIYRTESFFTLSLADDLISCRVTARPPESGFGLFNQPSIHIYRLGNLGSVATYLLSPI
jgi:hypothetical protein